MIESFSPEALGQIVACVFGGHFLSCGLLNFLEWLQDRLTPAAAGKDGASC
jgi:hypothetical protein